MRLGQSGFCILFFENLDQTPKMYVPRIHNTIWNEKWIKFSSLSTKKKGKHNLENFQFDIAWIVWKKMHKAVSFEIVSRGKNQI